MDHYRLGVCVCGGEGVRSYQLMYMCTDTATVGIPFCSHLLGALDIRYRHSVLLSKNQVGLISWY
jgi:hypothetical protein